MLTLNNEIRFKVCLQKLILNFCRDSLKFIQHWPHSLHTTASCQSSCQFLWTSIGTILLLQKWIMTMLHYKTSHSLWKISNWGKRPPISDSDITFQLRGPSESMKMKFLPVKSLNSVKNSFAKLIMNMFNHLKWKYKIDFISCNSSSIGSNVCRSVRRSVCP